MMRWGRLGGGVGGAMGREGGQRQQHHRRALRLRVVVVIPIFLEGDDLRRKSTTVTVSTLGFVTP